MVELLLDWNCDAGDASREHDDEHPVTLDASGDGARAQLPMMGTAFPYAAGWDGSSCDGLAE